MHLFDVAKTKVHSVFDKVPNSLDGGPEHHGPVPGRFKNPWKSADDSSIPEEWPFLQKDEFTKPIKPIDVVAPQFDKQCQSNEIKVTNLGHAGVIVQLPPLEGAARGISLICDPIWSDRASPTEKAGPSRRIPPPCKLEDLPVIDIVFISHNHYDHLDDTAMDAIIGRQRKETRYCVPLGVKEWFVERGVDSAAIVELDWWETFEFQASSFDASISGSENARIVVTCVPAQHNSARNGVDTSATLWAGFVVEQFSEAQSRCPKRTCVYFAGDTGYRGRLEGPVCPVFNEIGERFRQIDFAAIPIWRGGTLSFIAKIGLRLNPRALTLSTHATPEDAVCIHQEVRSRSSLAIHFGTFAGSVDAATLPVLMLEEACRNKGLPNKLLEDGGFGVTDVGETNCVPVRD